MKFIKRTDWRLTLILSVIRLSIIPCIILCFIIGNFADTVRLHKSLDMYSDSLTAMLECYDAYCESGDGDNYEKLVDSFTESMYIFPHIAVTASKTAVKSTLHSETSTMI